MKPIRITSPEICAWAVEVPNMAASARPHAGTMVLSLNMCKCLLWMKSETGPMRSDAQVLVQARHARRQLGLGELLDDLAVLHDQEAVGERRSEAEILLDHDDRVAALAQAPHDLAELLHDHRSEPLRDLVE